MGAPPGLLPPCEPSGFCSTRLYAGVALKQLIGPADARFPSIENDSTLLLDLAISPGDFLQWAGRPSSDWWPLLETLRTRGLFLRLPLAARGSTVSSIRKIARMEPKARFLVDPFLHGPTSSWPAHVRLAETHNIFLSTLGAFPPEHPSPECPQGPWQAGTLLATALHFVSGEVGAGKVFFASGSSSACPPSEEHVEMWLTSLGTLDKDQQRLIRGENVRELFGA